MELQKKEEQKDPEPAKFSHLPSERDAENSGPQCRSSRAGGEGAEEKNQG